MQRNSSQQADIYQRVPNNRYPNCFAIMNDGRAFTDYRSSGYVNNLIRMKYDIASSNDYKMFLMDNAESIIEENAKSYKTRLSCDCWNIYVPTHYQCIVDKTTSRCSLVDPNGIGTEFRAVNY
jgi:hypothetical protein